MWKAASDAWQACALPPRVYASSSARSARPHWLLCTRTPIQRFRWVSLSDTQSFQQIFRAHTYPLYNSCLPKCGVQERACQLTAALTLNQEACKSLVPGSLQGLLALCSMASPAAVREQACHALCRLARPSAGCHACSHPQAAGAPLTLLHLLQGTCPPCQLFDQGIIDSTALASRCMHDMLHATMQSFTRSLKRLERMRTL